jgi:hypothetical protein
MADQCMPGWILATLFGLSAIYYLVTKKKEQRANKDLLEARSESVNSIATTSGECRSSNVSDVDVIIVGAGVAGAALAHTLGKVFSFLLLHLLGNQTEKKELLFYFSLDNRLFQTLGFFIVYLANFI